MRLRNAHRYIRMGYKWSLLFVHRWKNESLFPFSVFQKLCSFGLSFPPSQWHLSKRNLNALCCNTRYIMEQINEKMPQLEKLDEGFFPTYVVYVHSVPIIIRTHVRASVAPTNRSHWLFVNPFLKIIVKPSVWKLMDVLRLDNIAKLFLFALFCGLFFFFFFFFFLWGGGGGFLMQLCFTTIFLLSW